MKKTTLISAFTLAILMLFSINTNAQKFSDLDRSPMDAASFPSDYKDSNKLIKIIYSRPQLKDRKIEELTPNGKVWRTGANEAAELTLYKPMVLGTEVIEPGTYTFYLIPGEEEWIAVINKDINVWGSYFYKEDRDVARVAVPVTEGKDYLETFSIAFEDSSEGVHMHIGWGNMRIAVPFVNK